VQASKSSRPAEKPPERVRVPLDGLRERAEALTNVAKHARASQATVVACVDDGILQLRVRDDGVGGARPEGSGFVGLADRLAALDGHPRVESPPDGGTPVAADIPLHS
jgi:signal transduction histidine kinase